MCREYNSYPSEVICIKFALLFFRSIKTHFFKFLDMIYYTYYFFWLHFFPVFSFCWTSGLQQNHSYWQKYELMDIRSWRYQYDQDTIWISSSQFWCHSIRSLYILKGNVIASPGEQLRIWIYKKKYIYIDTLMASLNCE